MKLDSVVAIQLTDRGISCNFYMPTRGDKVASSWCMHCHHQFILVNERVTLFCANTCTRSQRSFEWDLKVPWNPWCCIVMNVSLDKLIMWSIVPVLCLYLTLLKDDKHLTITCISNLHCFKMTTCLATMTTKISYKSLTVVDKNKNSHAWTF